MRRRFCHLRHVLAVKRHFSIFFMHISILIQQVKNIQVYITYKILYTYLLLLFIVVLFGVKWISPVLLFINLLNIKCYV